MHVEDAGFGLFREERGVFHHDLPGVVAVGNRVFGQGTQVAGSNNVIERLGRFQLVGRVLVDQSSQACRDYFAGRLPWSE